MVRAIIGVIVGYLVMAVVVAVTMLIAYIALGVNGVFEPDSWDITTKWMIVWGVTSVVAAVIGGLVCALIAVRGSKAPKVLALIVLLLGLGSGAYTLQQYRDAGDPGPRPADVDSQTAMMDARQPEWMLFATPVIGAVGVLIGGALRGGKRPNRNSAS